MKETIYYKWPDPCNCGCQGQDHWHRQSYKRVIKDIVGDTGKVKMPFSTKLVKVVKNKYGMWVIDKTSIVFDI